MHFKIQLKKSSFKNSALTLPVRVKQGSGCVGGKWSESCDSWTVSLEKEKTNTIWKNGTLPAAAAS